MLPVQLCVPVVVLVRVLVSDAVCVCVRVAGGVMLPVPDSVGVIDGVGLAL